MSYRPRPFRDLPAWSWRLYLGLVLLGLVYALGSWLWGQL